MKYFIILFFSFFSLKSIAQINASEAKATYILAEEAFSTSEWKSALGYLEECKKHLGKANAKVLYMQIMTELEIAKTEPSYYDKALKTIATFEKAPDVKLFTEEKVLEVSKLKYKIKELKVKAEEDVKKAENEKRRLESAGGIIIYKNDGEGLVVASEDLGRMNWNDAKKACEDLVLNGHDDWYLPSLEELKLIYEKLHKTGELKLPGVTYWSNKEERGPYRSLKLAWYLSVKEGFTDHSYKYGKTYVRAVRKL